MEPGKSLIEATETKWRWIFRCLRLREEVRSLALEASRIEKEKDAKHLLKIELDSVKTRLTERESELNKAKEGTRSLLRFIRIRHTPDINYRPSTNAELFS